MNTRTAEKINDIIADNNTTLICMFKITDESVQAELRLRCDWKIKYPVDIIKYPGDLSRENPLWQKMSRLDREINRARLIFWSGQVDSRCRVSASSKTKSGVEKRNYMKELFENSCADEFLSAFRKASQKRSLSAIRNKISDLQSEQKKLIPQLRAANSAYLASRKSQKYQRDAENALALKEGRFWDCDKDAIKDYFHPPFSRNYLADVSEKWRAALYTQMDSTAYKGYGGDWRHKNIGTGYGYLCGIDDNGDEWSHRVDLRGYMNQDDYGDYQYRDASVEKAMSVLFNVPLKKLDIAVRQGDLLFVPTTLDEFSVSALEMAESWDIRESHRVSSPSLRHNGNRMYASDPIKITHTSHATVELPAGSYRLYTIPDAD